MLKLRLRFDYVIPAIILSFVFSFFVLHNFDRKEILVIHSYGKDYSWVLDVDLGLKDVFGKNNGYDVGYHYMDTKRNTKPEFLRNAGMITRRLISAIRPEVIICIDDNAQRLVGQYYIDDKDIKVVFTGVNANKNTYGYEKAKNVTGILERLPLSGLRDTFYIIAKQKGIPENSFIRAAHISSNSETVQKDDHYIRAFLDWGRVDLKESHLLDTFDKWKSAIHEAGQSLDFIIISNYRTIKRNPRDEKFMPPEEIIRWTMENSKIPAIGVNTFFVEDGGGLAIATSPFEQGSVAASQAERIVLKSISPTQIPVVETEQFIVCIRESVINKMGIDLPDIYDAFARVTKKYYK